MKLKDITLTMAVEEWGKGENIYSIQVGMVGPSHEQAIQIVTFELLNLLLNDGKVEFEKWENLSSIKEQTKYLDALMGKIKLSSTLTVVQWGAARQLAYNFITIGYMNVIQEHKSSLIQVTKSFPLSPGSSNE